MNKTSLKITEKLKNKTLKEASDINTVADIPENWAFIQDIAQVDDIKEKYTQVKKTIECDSFYVEVAKDEYLNVYGMIGVVPDINKVVYPIVINGVEYMAENKQEGTKMKKLFAESYMLEDFDIMSSKEGEGKVSELGGDKYRIAYKNGKISVVGKNIFTDMIDDGYITRVNRKIDEASVPDQHQLKILKDTVINPMKSFLGGPNASEAEKILKTKFKFTDEQIKALKEEVLEPVERNMINEEVPEEIDEDKKWIQKAIEHKGALTKEFPGLAKDGFSKEELEKIIKTGNDKQKKQAQLALTLKSFKEAVDSIDNVPEEVEENISEAVLEKSKYDALSNIVTSLSKEELESTMEILGSLIAKDPSIDVLKLSGIFERSFNDIRSALNKHGNK